MTPITTVTPRLEQEYRYDQFQQYLQNGGEINNFGGGKGFELIPTTTNEILINVPAYEQRLYHEPATGFADGNFVTIKQRLLSANEELASLEPCLRGVELGIEFWSVDCGEYLSLFDMVANVDKPPLDVTSYRA